MAAHSAALGSLCLMDPELDLTTCLATLGGDIAYRQGGNFSDTQARINGQDKRQSIAISVARGLDNSENPSNFVVSEDRSLSHDDALS
jgi:hypothetical protein